MLSLNSPHTPETVRVTWCCPHSTAETTVSCCLYGTLLYIYHPRNVYLFRCFLLSTFEHAFTQKPTGLGVYMPDYRCSKRASIGPITNPETPSLSTLFQQHTEFSVALTTSDPRHLFLQCLRLTLSSAICLDFRNSWADSIS